MQLPERIEIRKEVLGGAACVRGTRIAVHTLLNLLAAGDSEERLLVAYPQLTSEDLKACLQYAADLVAEKNLVEAS
jgi:uncharacterized protein (DUF433 family)